jgi:hypothetical protein
MVSRFFFGRRNRVAHVRTTDTARPASGDRLRATGSGRRNFMRIKPDSGILHTKSKIFPVSHLGVFPFPRGNEIP